MQLLQVATGSMPAAGLLLLSTEQTFGTWVSAATVVCVPTAAFSARTVG